MNVSVPKEAIIEGPHVQWTHIDGPLMTWAGLMHWLTFGERLRLRLRLTTVENLASKQWPFIAMQRKELMSANQQ